MVINIKICFSYSVILASLVNLSDKLLREARQVDQTAPEVTTLTTCTRSVISPLIIN